MVAALRVLSNDDVNGLGLTGRLSQSAQHNSIMSCLIRTSLHRAAFRNTPLAFCRPLARPAALKRPVNLNSTLLYARTVASSVSNRPASQSLEHAAMNVKEELGNSASDLAKVIAANDVTKDSVAPYSNTTFVRWFYVVGPGTFPNFLHV